jgi:hypothetical protein
LKHEMTWATISAVVCALFKFVRQMVKLLILLWL